MQKQSKITECWEIEFSEEEEKRAIVAFEKAMVQKVKKQKTKSARKN